MQAKFRGVEDGKIQLATRDEKLIKLDPSRLSDEDQEYLEKKLEAFREKKAAHNAWSVKQPFYWTEEVPNYHDTVHNVGGGVQQHIPVHGPSDGYHTVQHKKYTYQPLHATLVSYEGTDVTLKAPNGLEQTFKYGLFQTADQKFLAEYRSLEKENSSLSEVDLPRSYSYQNAQQFVGQYDFGAGKPLSLSPNGVVESEYYGAGKWFYDEHSRRVQIHLNDTKYHDFFVKPTSKGNLNVKGTNGKNHTCRRISR